MFGYKERQGDNTKSEPDLWTLGLWQRCYNRAEFSINDAKSIRYQFGRKINYD